MTSGDEGRHRAASRNEVDFWSLRKYLIDSAGVGEKTAYDRLVIIKQLKRLCFTVVVTPREIGGSEQRSSAASIVVKRLLDFARGSLPRKTPELPQYRLGPAVRSALKLCGVLPRLKLIWADGLRRAPFGLSSGSKTVESRIRRAVDRLDQGGRRVDDGDRQTAW